MTGYGLALPPSPRRSGAVACGAQGYACSVPAACIPVFAMAGRQATSHEPICKFLLNRKAGPLEVLK